MPFSVISRRSVPIEGSPQLAYARLTAKPSIRPESSRCSWAMMSPNDNSAAACFHPDGAPSRFSTSNRTTVLNLVTGSALRPEVVLLLERRLVEPGREDQELGLGVLVVVERAERLAGNPHRGLGPGLEDVVAELERDDPREDEVQLLVAGMAVPVAAAPARARQHA